MRNADIINQIFSQALGQLQQRWQDSAQTPQTNEQTASPPPLPVAGSKPVADSELVASSVPDADPASVAPPAPDAGADPNAGDESDEVEDELLLPAIEAGASESDEIEREENMVARKPQDDDDIPDLPPPGAQDTESDDLDSLLEDLARSADPDQERDDALDGLFAPDDMSAPDEDADALPPMQDELSEEQTGHSLDDLLEHALGLADTPEDPTAGIDDDDAEESADAMGGACAPEDEDVFGALTGGRDPLVEPAMQADDAADNGENAMGNEMNLDTLLGNAEQDDEGDRALSDDLFGAAGDDADGGFAPGEDLSSLLGGSDNAGDDDEPADVVQTVKVPEPSVPLLEDADEELERKLAEMGLGADNLLHNRFSAEKEKLLKHLLDRFEALARRKLEPLPAQQVNLVRSVNLRVEIDLKFGEFSTTGNDDSLFKLEV